MQPQPPLPTSAPPPPPPPLSLSAFTQAASAAARYAPTFRKPTLQLAVLLGSPHRLLPHAHSILCSLSAKGVHGFLQTEIEHPTSGLCSSITPETLPDVIATSHADFLVLLADRNVQTRTVQLRLPPQPDFIDVPLANLCNIVLDTWTQRLRTVNNLAHLQALASNPNVVTTAHLDSLLHSISTLSALRRSYAKLARLANITQDWRSMRVPKPSSVSHHSQPPPQPQLTTQQPQPLATPLPSSTPVQTSSVAPTWNYSEDLSSTSSCTLPALPSNTNTASANTDQPSPHRDDLRATASCEPSGQFDAHSPISTHSPAVIQSKGVLPIETQAPHPQRLTVIPPNHPNASKTLLSDSRTTTALAEAQTPDPTMTTEQSSPAPGDPPAPLSQRSSTTHADVSSQDLNDASPHLRPLAATALRRGLASITRAHVRSQRSSEKRSSRPEFSFSWLKRSQHLSAKILRHQFLACHLHRTLLEARDTISRMQTSSLPAAYHEPNRLPTEAHRQRLLREIHGLVPRIEELGKRLSKRPREKHRCRVLRQTNPWDAYITKARYAAMTRGIQGSNEQTKEMSSAGWWRCWACRALNDPDVTSCFVCCSQPCGIAPNLAPAYMDRLSEELRDAIKSARVGPLPWIFTPGVIPIPPSIAHSFTTGWVPKDQGDSDLLNNPFSSKDSTGSLSGKFQPFHNGCNELPERSLRPQGPFNLSTAFSKLQFDDGYKRRGVPQFGQVPELNTPMKARRNEARPFPKRNSPTRLATSAPSGPSVSDLMSHIPRNGIQNNTSRDELVFGKSISGSVVSHDMGFGGKPFDPLKQNASISGSLPNIEPRGSNGTHGPKQPESSSIDESYQLDFRMTGFTERSYPSRFKSSLSNSTDELALRSYDTKGIQMLPDEKHSINSAEGPASGEFQSGGIASLKALAAASDAANGGTGSATKESLRTVSAAITAADDESQKPMAVPRIPNGTYNMF